MTEQQHRATAGDWASVKSCANDVVTYSCILELLHRIEELENAQPAKSNHPEIPDSSLVDLVANAMYPETSGDGFRVEARAAIYAVAAWMGEQKPYGAGFWSLRLEQEAER